MNLFLQGHKEQSCFLGAGKRCYHIGIHINFADEVFVADLSCSTSDLGELIFHVMRQAVESKLAFAVLGLKDSKFEATCDLKHFDLSLFEPLDHFGRTFMGNWTFAIVEDLSFFVIAHVLTPVPDVLLVVYGIHSNALACDLSHVDAIRYREWLERGMARATIMAQDRGTFSS